MVLVVSDWMVLTVGLWFAILPGICVDLTRVLLVGCGYCLSLVGLDLRTKLITRFSVWVACSGWWVLLFGVGAGLLLPFWWDCC